MMNGSDKEKRETNSGDIIELERGPVFCWVFLPNRASSHIYPAVGITSRRPAGSGTVLDSEKLPRSPLKTCSLMS
jgi:hypothetical protein